MCRLLSSQFAVLLLAAVTSAAAPGDEKPSANGPRFVDLELGPGILKLIGKPSRIGDWTQPEIDAYYLVLDFAARTDFGAQQKKASQNVLSEIKRYRTETEEDHQKRLKAIEASADEDGALITARKQSAAAARRRQRLKLAGRYEDDPREFPIFARMTNSLLREGQASRFRGKLVTMRGHIRKLVSYDAHANAQGITRLYEAWLYTKDSATNPAVIICTSIPEGMPIGDRISESVTVTGYVFRLHQYEALSKKGRYAPMVLARQIDWKPREEPPGLPAWLPGALIALVVLIGLAVFFIGRGDKARHRHAVDLAIQDGQEQPVIAPPDDGEE